jgi:DHA2 family multidrug resistance protein
VQTSALALLFVPISTAAYATLPNEQHGDAAALFTMARNVLGGIGISVSTALVTDHKEIRQGYLIDHLTPLSQPYNELLDQLVHAATAAGQSLDAARLAAPGKVFGILQEQVAVLAYSDVFYISGLLALMMVPIALFMAGGRHKARSGE